MMIDDVFRKWGVCHYCGKSLLVKTVEFNEDGTTKRIEYYESGCVLKKQAEACSPRTDAKPSVKP